MTKFYFNIRDDDGVVPDEEDKQVSSLKAGHREAMESARELLADTLTLHQRMEATSCSWWYAYFRLNRPWLSSLPAA
jgi:hypothetical protein